MQDLGARREHPELKQLVLEASRALARLDAPRLEELALSCQALNRDLSAAGPRDRLALARQSRDAAADMAVFARVLDATLGNLNVINRLRELRQGCSGYGGGLAQGWTAQGWKAQGWKVTESRHGDN
jgi:hypothetical protein